MLRPVGGGATTFAFQTRTGKLGILQATSSVDKLCGIGIRFKLEDTFHQFVPGMGSESWDALPSSAPAHVAVLPEVAVVRPTGRRSAFFFENKPPAAQAAELKLFGGKVLYQMRLVRTDLDHATRLKAFQALEAFAEIGKSTEALTAILARSESRSAAGC